ncbi:LacI family DNA-binding transcriptional regulator [Cohaesibacter celericrescens]|uniref:LacI family transcriptional regulator n=1 Tax=Cohaesibacter celericrescens TaxID=2067669 RepID=A0A2N5XQY6_9HYPH|nr:LacI family DNA-binding transcriptional regulator [Cohaesibacter celericrescens]PLW76860.1 LacI family transcriptional regulator [Cohaesibacter celericrescens]
MSTKARIKDIAVRAGVSPATVSRALSGSSLVAGPTVTQIQQVAASMGYRPNISARNLRTQKTMSILIVVRDIGNPFYLNVFKGVESVAHDAGYSVLMGNTENDSKREADYFDMLQDGHADGMILMTGKMPRGYKLPKNISDKVVVALEMIDDVDLSHVVIDNEQASIDVVNHLISLGHKRIAHIAGPVPEGMSARRLRSFRKAMKQEGLAVPDDYVQQGDFSYQSGEAATKRLLALESRPTAIYAANDEMAFGAIRAARDEGLSIPQDLSIIGFDDIYLAGAFVPALTTVNQPCLEIGQQAMNRLLAHLAGENPTTEPIVVPTHIVMRETTAPPMKGS